MNATELTTEKVVASFKRVVTEAEELLKATAGAVGEKAGVLRERLTETLETARRNCRELEGIAVDRAKATDKVIREHPYQSIGMAFGIGVLLGALVTRR